MNFTITNASAQQEQWINDAIAQCSYPLDGLDVNVTITVVQSLPATSELLGHSHAYMVTEGINGSGPFTISIIHWADNPANPNNAGLPNPAADIYEFFKESVVHELGHVVTYTTIGGDNALRDQAAQQFWTPSVDGGSGRRYGALADWSEPTWDHNMAESLAEAFKCGFYPTNSLLFLDRTVWEIDESNWSSFLDLISPNHGIIEDFAGGPDGHIIGTPVVASGTATIGGGGANVGPGGAFEISAESFAEFAPSPVFKETIKVVALPDPTLDYLAAVQLSALLYGGDGSISVGATLIVAPSGSVTDASGSGHAVLAVATGANDGSLMLANGQNHTGGVTSQFQAGTPAAGISDAAAMIISIPTAPFWLRLVVNESATTFELWTSDPKSGGSPLHTLPALAALPAGQWYPVGAVVSDDGDGVGGSFALASVVVDEYRWTFPGTLDAPYPFTPPYINAGPPEGGSIRLG